MSKRKPIPDLFEVVEDQYLQLAIATELMKKDKQLDRAHDLLIAVSELIVSLKKEPF